MLSHYNYVFDEITRTYNFTTKNNIEYKVVFIEDYTLDNFSDKNFPNVYQIVIEKVNDEVEPLDIRVGKTVEHIITAFFENVHNSMIYMCSDDGEKAKKRFDSFDRWYRNSTASHTITKVDNVINFEGENMKCIGYSSLLYHNQNPDIEYIITAYKSIEEILSNK